MKYAYDNNAKDCEWNNKSLYHDIFFDTQDYTFKVDVNIYGKSQNIYFSKREVAEQAIKDVIEPFMKEHPEFIW